MKFIFGMCLWVHLVQIGVEERGNSLLISAVRVRDMPRGSFFKFYDLSEL